MSPWRMALGAEARENARTRMDLLGSLRLADLQVFASALRCGSLDEGARDCGVTLARMAEAVDAIERALGATLVDRSAGPGLVLTSRGAALAEHLEAIADRARALEIGLHAAPTLLVVVAPSYLLEAALPALASGRRGGLQGITAAAGDASALARSGAADAIVTVGGRSEIGGSWSFTELGALRFALFGSKAAAFALGPRPTATDVASRPFVGCVGAGSTGVATGDDLCPLPRRDRIIAHEVQTMALACRVAAETDALVYGPALAAASLVAAGALVEIDLPSWEREEVVLLQTDVARVGTSKADWLAATFRSVLRAPPATSAIVPAVAADDERGAVRQGASGTSSRI